VGVCRSGLKLRGDEARADGHRVARLLALLAAEVLGANFGPESAGWTVVVLLFATALTLAIPRRTEW